MGEWVTDWVIREFPRPYAFIQWKGTDVCADYYCICGEQFHIDEDFAYGVQCHHCNRRYEVSAHIELRELAPDEGTELDCKRDAEANELPEEWPETVNG